MTSPRPPFVGLSAFTPHSAAYFTGRERFALTLVGTLLRSRISVLFGASGCGKSSVLGAALPQALDAVAGEPELRSDFDGAAEHRPLRMLQFRRWHPGFEHRLFPAAAAKLGVPPGTPLRQAIMHWADAGGGPLVLVLDQFEEFLLYHPDPLASPLIRHLSAITAEERLQTHVLLALREDSLAKLEILRPVLPSILASPVQLQPLTATAARVAILAPVARWSEQHFGSPAAVTVHDDLVATLLEEVRIPATPGVTRGGVQEFVELPILQMSLERLWREEAAGGTPGEVRLATLQALGGTKGIIAEHLKSTVGRLKPDQQTIAAELLGHLVTSSGAKHAWKADDLAAELMATETLARRAAERRMLGRVLFFSGRARAVESKARRSAVLVEEILQALAAGRARILRTQPDPRGRGRLFELLHDAMAQPVLNWVQDMRIEAEGHRQNRKAVAIVTAFLLVAAASYYAYNELLDRVPWGYVRELSTGRINWLKGPAITIGRPTDEMGVHNDVELTSRLVSRLHVFLTRAGVVVDVRSTNGTTINAGFLRYAYSGRLESGDILALAGVAPLEFHLIEHPILRYVRPDAEHLSLLPPPAVAWGVLIDGAQRHAIYLTASRYFLNMDETKGISLSETEQDGYLMTLNRHGKIAVVQDRADGVALQAQIKERDSDYHYPVYTVREGQDVTVDGGIVFYYRDHPFQILLRDPPEA